MNKQKLIQIIVKDLEELKTLTTELTESEGNSTLAISLALSRAKLLAQEIELLQDIAIESLPVPGENADEIIQVIEEEEEEEIPVYPEPELEIINFEDKEPTEEELVTEEEPVEEELEEEEEIVYDSDEEEIEDTFEHEEPDEEPEDIIAEETEIEFETVQPGLEEEEEDPDDTDEEEDIEEEELDEIEEDFETDDDKPEEEIQEEAEVQINDLKPDIQIGIREIQIEDLDDEESEPTLFTPLSKPAGRPVMHEIPKPENEAKEKQVVGETFQKEPTLNDVIAESKSVETNLGNGPISSLKSSIGLNDRFLFIREIFDNNTDKYNTIIDNLDKLETIQQAVDYLKANLTLQKNETSMKFVDLLKRRFVK